MTIQARVASDSLRWSAKKKKKFANLQVSTAPQTVALPLLHDNAEEIWLCTPEFSASTLSVPSPWDVFPIHFTELSLTDAAQ